MLSEPLLHHPFDASNFLRPELRTVVVGRPVVRGEFEGLGGAQSRTVQQLQSGRMEPMIDQSEARVGGAAKNGVMIVTQPSAQSQVMDDGELVLPVQGPVG